MDDVQKKDSSFKAACWRGVGIVLKFLINDLENKDKADSAIEDLEDVVGNYFKARKENCKETSLEKKGE